MWFIDIAEDLENELDSEKKVKAFMDMPA